MKTTEIDILGVRVPCHSLNTLIIGSGASSLNAAVQLARFGQRDIAVVTEGWGEGTSNNAGSDKQTYYKLSLAGDFPDSPRQMAEDLYSGGCMHGDIALCEALGSPRAFFHLAELGVPFPYNRYGGYIGYKTDHDPLGRATSAGPLTSHLMFQALAAEVEKKAIPVLDRHDVIALLIRPRGDETHVIGAIALDKSKLESRNRGLVIFNAVNIVLGTGGPAGIYGASVYPEGQTGSHGLALSVGAVAHNLTESQFGLASVKFRWNLSGTYQQVIPRYISTDRDGGNEREFLNEFFPDMGRLATAVFLKGYQWPFDPRKVRNHGSSLIDLLVYRETGFKGRRVFLDFLNNPSGGGNLTDFSFDLLDEEAYRYLEKSKALFGKPIDRLKRMNQPAVDLFRENGIDLENERLEIAVCAQHNNGGLKGNIWWESNLRHLFPVGEVNGTHGVFRPGGSALNSGQVGGLRAALFISKRYSSLPSDTDEFKVEARTQLEEKIGLVMKLAGSTSADDAFLRSAREDIRKRMSSFGAHIRSPGKIDDERRRAWDLLERVEKRLAIPSAAALPDAFKILDLCLTHAVFLEAISEYLERGGKSRGSYLVLDENGTEPCAELGEEWKFSLNEKDSYVERKILEIRLDKRNDLVKEWVDIRPIPEEDMWFENVWNVFLRDEIVE